MSKTGNKAAIPLRRPRLNPRLRHEVQSSVFDFYLTVSWVVSPRSDRLAFAPLRYRPGVGEYSDRTVFLDVPERLINPGNCAHQHCPPRRILPVKHLQCLQFDLVSPFQIASKLRHCRRNRVRAASRIGSPHPLCHHRGYFEEQPPRRTLKSSR